jgi:hypothetical protein
MKEQRTTKELADMIAARLGGRDVHVMVHRDPVEGWHPTVVTEPAQVIACQRRAEQIAAELRTEFELNA